ncbi:MAG: hopanoid biosynthesis associated radical SAM protein HpnJ, partial [Candidatus Latescibacteria bacterium]|nr:hopanoid biosynthesis associated radical SAM protein HpnJ [Candidatus Latescibacterota bacterium]
AVPEDTFSLSDGMVDGIARGEYDYTLRDLADGKPLEETEGLCYQRDGEVVTTPDRAPLDVNELP